MPPLGARRERAAGIEAPACFIVVCNNTSTSKLVHDFIAGFSRANEGGSTTLVNGRLPLFRVVESHPRGSAPTSRTTTSAWTRRTATVRRRAATCPTSSCW